MVIGVTGKYCAGKNAVTRILEEKGFEVIDVDKLGHEALVYRQEDIVARFGRDILTPDNRIDRKKLGTKVFGRPGELLALEQIVHPWMKEQVNTGINQSENSRDKVINAALLFYLDLHHLCDVVFLVRASLVRRFFRAIRRDNLSWISVIKRFCSQTKLSAQYEENDVDIYYIDNSRGIEGVARQVDRVLASLK